METSGFPAAVLTSTLLRRMLQYRTKVLTEYMHTSLLLLNGREIMNCYRIVDRQRKRDAFFNMSIYLSAYFNILYEYIGEEIAGRKVCHLEGYLPLENVYTPSKIVLIWQSIATQTSAFYLRFIMCSFFCIHLCTSPVHCIYYI